MQTASQSTEQDGSESCTGCRNVACVVVLSAWAPTSWGPDGLDSHTKYFGLGTHPATSLPIICMQKYQYLPTSCIFMSPCVSLRRKTSNAAVALIADRTANDVRYNRNKQLST